MGDGQIAMMQIQEARRTGIPIIVIGDGTYAANSILSPAEQALGPNDYYINLGKWYLERPDEIIQLVAKLQKTWAAVTTEFENVPVALLEFFEYQWVRLAPGKEAFAICRDKLKEKKHFQAHRIPHTEFMELGTNILGEQRIKIEQHLPGFVKIRELGYDGKWNKSVKTFEDVQKLLTTQNWADGKKSPFFWASCILEKKVDFEYEMSVVLLRDKDGKIIIWAVPKNFQDNGILVASAISEGMIPQNIKDEAIAYAIWAANAMNYEWILVVEFFVDKNGTVRANEMAPRPHNSGHHTIEGMWSGSQYALQNLLSRWWSSVNQIIESRCIQYSRNSSGIYEASQIVPHIGLVNVLGTTLEGVATSLHIIAYGPQEAANQNWWRGIRRHMIVYGKVDPRLVSTKMAHIVLSAISSQELITKIQTLMRKLHPNSGLPW